MSQMMTENQMSTMYKLLLAGGIAIIAVMGFVRMSMAPAEPMAPVTILRIVAFALVATELSVILFMRSQVPQRSVSQGFDAWITGGGSRLIIVWVLAEGLIVIGSVFWFMTGDLVPLAVLAMPGLGVLFSSPPGKFVA